MPADVFFDSNVLLYMFSSNEPQKAARSDALVRAGGTVSVQVLNEFTHVARRKLRFPMPDIRLALLGIRRTCQVVPLTADVHDLGLDLIERHGLQVCDAMIVAAAQSAGCSTLFSEDMHNGMVMGGLTIRNPYVP